MTSIITITNLTTVFTQPTSCSTLWTYEAEVLNSVPNGILLQNANPSPIDTACFPPGYTGSGRGEHNQVFSPGICLSGYTTGLLQEGSIVTAVCCPTSFTFTASLAADAGQRNPGIFSGCVSTFTGGTTAVPARSTMGTSSIFLLNSTSVSGLITMWAQPITVAFQQKDLTLSPTATTSTSVSLKTNSPTAITISSSSAFSSAFSSVFLSASSSVFSSVSHHSSSISIGATVGIGITGLIIILIILVAAIFIFRKRKNTKSNLQVVTEANMENIREGASGLTVQRHEMATGTEPVELDGDPNPYFAHTVK